MESHTQSRNGGRCDFAMALRAALACTSHGALCGQHDAPSPQANGHSELHQKFPEARVIPSSQRSLSHYATCIGVTLACDRVPKSVAPGAEK
eukprot:10524562-Karenia_brevis.AAC.1